MRHTTLCYITRGEEVLMLHRVKKENDLNHDKWIGIGGKIEVEESPDECICREVREETGLTLTAWRCRGVITFRQKGAGGEYMYLFTANCPAGELASCDEGDLAWIPWEKLYHLPMWEGDRIFLELLQKDAPFFLLTLDYTGDVLTGAVCNGEAIPVGSGT